MQKLRAFLGLFKRAGSDMMTDRVPMMGAAVAYYTVFSIAPLLVIALALVRLVYGAQGGSEIFQSIRGLVGPNGATAIQSMVQASSKEASGGIIAAILGVITLLVGATGVFAQLQDSLDLIWKVAPKPSAGWWALVRQRLLSLGMIAIVAFLLLVSLFVSTALAAMGRFLTSGSLPGGVPLWHGINFVVSLGVITFLFAMMLKVLPDAVLSWRDVGLGGFFTAVLFTIGKFLIGLYLGKSSVASAYGAAGSLVIVLLWVYYSSQIVLFGAEFAHAYATRGGRPVRPKPVAETAVSPLNITPFSDSAGREPERKPAKQAR